MRSQGLGGIGGLPLMSTVDQAGPVTRGARIAAALAGHETASRGDSRVGHAAHCALINRMFLLFAPNGGMQKGAWLSRIGLRFDFCGLLRSSPAPRREVVTAERPTKIEARTSWQMVRASGESFKSNLKDRMTEFYAFAACWASRPGIV
jgi:hypothetical protein